MSEVKHRRADWPVYNKLVKEKDYWTDSSKRRYYDSRQVFVEMAKSLRESYDLSESKDKGLFWVLLPRGMSKEVALEFPDESSTPVTLTRRNETMNVIIESCEWKARGATGFCAVQFVTAKS